MSKNSLKHGLLRKKLKLMPDESHYLFNKFNSSLIEQWKPRNAVEFMLVEQLAFNYWRLKRAFRLETEQLERAAQEAQNWRSKTKQSETFVTDFLNFDRFDKFSRYITSIQRQILRNLRELQKIQKDSMAGIEPVTIDENPKPPMIEQ